MKTTISILMSCLFLFQGIAPNMEVCEQVEQLSNFFDHYQEHRQSDGYSFLEFVYADYIDKKENPNDHHQNQDSGHKDAPAHTSHQCCQHFVFFVHFQAPKINVVPNHEQNPYNYYAFQLNSRFLESLFQPPRV